MCWSLIITNLSYKTMVKYILAKIFKLSEPCPIEIYQNIPIAMTDCVSWGIAVNTHMKISLVAQSFRVWRGETLYLE